MSFPVIFYVNLHQPGLVPFAQPGVGVLFSKADQPLADPSLQPVDSAARIGCAKHPDMGGHQHVQGLAKPKPAVSDGSA